jgi:hypothetical protein
MKITKRQLRQIILETFVLLNEDERDIVDLKPYGEWIDDLMRILHVDDPDKIPDITSYDAYNHGMTTRRYADLIGEPSESHYQDDKVRAAVKGDSEEDWTHDFEKEIDQMISGEKPMVVDISDYRGS